MAGPPRPQGGCAAMSEALEDWAATRSPPRLRPRGLCFRRCSALVPPQSLPALLWNQPQQCLPARSWAGTVPCVWERLSYRGAEPCQLLVGANTASPSLMEL